MELEVFLNEAPRTAGGVPPQQPVTKAKGVLKVSLKTEGASRCDIARPPVKPLPPLRLR